MLKDLIEKQEYAEQRETFKRLSKLKSGGTDMSEPKTFHRTKIMSQNRKANTNTFQEAEHARELKSLKERL